MLVVGAGLSGIGVACRLARRGGTRFVVLERRQAIGGTWDLFRYPGVRSDSDMYSFGYAFRPWHGTDVLASGESIRQYVQDTARAFGVDEHVRFGRRVVAARWAGADARWRVEVVDEATGAKQEWVCRFLVGATGYYDYDGGHRPEFPGEADYTGRVVHPQQWPADLDHTGKRVVVIGSGATAITLVPAMAAQAAHVTMLQRSPTYVMPVPAVDPVSRGLARVGVPARTVHRLGRSRNVLLQRALYDLSKKAPAVARALLLAGVRLQLRGRVDLRHFTPSYAPWDERLCVVPSGDLFAVLRQGRASVVTDVIDTFTPTGVRLASGQEIEADVVVTATGLRVQMLGGARLEVDGEPVRVPERVLYKGMLLDGVPNALVVLGYTNASWTLKADLVSDYLCRLLDHMDEHGHAQVVAVADDADRSDVSALGDALRSGYVQRADGVMPRQGTRAPWRVLDHYYRDRRALRRDPVADDALRFGAALDDAVRATA